MVFPSSPVLFLMPNKQDCRAYTTGSLAVFYKPASTNEITELF